MTLHSPSCVVIRCATTRDDKVDTWASQYVRQVNFRVCKRLGMVLEALDPEEDVCVRVGILVLQFQVYDRVSWKVNTRILRVKIAKSLRETTYRNSVSNKLLCKTDVSVKIMERGVIDDVFRKRESGNSYERNIHAFGDWKVSKA